ncbi:hypothetical protein ABWK43_18100 [Bacillus thuringiensis]|uniref:hypothetical protein n=1 Tax=Bacillus thuringiensis TaxID=1428 RepID=UPI0009027C77
MMQFNKRNGNNAEFYKGEKVTPFEYDLPEEGKAFQTIGSILSTNNRILVATRTRSGQELGQDVGDFCRRVTLNNQVVNDTAAATNYEAQFIFFKKDFSGYIIANRQHGEVLESVFANNDSLITAPYANKTQQVFGKSSYSDKSFRLYGDHGAITTCGDKWNSWTRITMSGSNENQARYVFKHGDTSFPITIPTKLEPTTLGPIPELTNLDDVGTPPAPAVVGTALLPCIFVNDRTPSQRIQDSPYYVLECYDYWKLIKSSIIQPGGFDNWWEETGIHSNVQAAMKNMINISIGDDKRLRFFNLSDPFHQSIVEDINIPASTSNSDLSFITAIREHTNPYSTRLRFAKYFVARKFELKRLDGSTPIYTWEYIDDTKYVMKEFRS